MRCRFYAIVPIPWSVFLMGPSQRLHADAKQDATEILKQTGITGGFIVHLGVGTGELTAALRQGDGIQVQGLDRDAAVVQKARQRILAMGTYGLAY